VHGDSTVVPYLDLYGLVWTCMDLASNVTEYNILIPLHCSPLFSTVLHCSPLFSSTCLCSSLFKTCGVAGIEGVDSMLRVRTTSPAAKARPHPQQQQQFGTEIAEHLRPSHSQRAVRRTGGSGPHDESPVRGMFGPIGCRGPRQDLGACHRGPTDPSFVEKQPGA
jgi:hypothetical protein